METTTVVESTESHSTNNNKKNTIPSTCFPLEFAAVMNHEDVAHILEVQSSILSNLQDSHTSLTTLNDHSQKKYKELSREIQGNVKMLKGMRRDLDNIFTRTRAMQRKINERYPHLVTVENMDDHHVEDTT